ncbi:MAG: hypothetical protein ABGZ17_25800, partial [Planctomycetaceae bacterium]
MNRSQPLAKRAIHLLLGATLAVSASGCGQTPAETPAETPAVRPAETAEVKVDKDPPASKDKRLAAVRARAETLLQLLRDEQWKHAADLVLINAKTRPYFRLSEEVSEKQCRERIAEKFQGMYGIVKSTQPSNAPGQTRPVGRRPGSVKSIRFDRTDPDLAWVSYR